MMFATYTAALPRPWPGGRAGAPCPPGLSLPTVSGQACCCHGDGVCGGGGGGGDGVSADAADSGRWSSPAAASSQCGGLKTGETEK